MKGKDKIINKRLEEKLEVVAPDIIQAIVDKYDEELVDIVTDRNSKTNPNLYREEFVDRLESSSLIIKDADNKISIVVPDMENFDFSGRLRVIKTIMEGLAGVYVEMNEEDYKLVFGKRPINEDTLDDYIPAKERIYLIRYSAKIRKVEKDLKRKFVIYPFSNTAPIEILVAGDDFVNENIESWIDEVLKISQKDIAKAYKGAII